MLCLDSASQRLSAEAIYFAASLIVCPDCCFTQFYTLNFMIVILSSACYKAEGADSRFDYDFELEAKHSKITSLFCPEARHEKVCAYTFLREPRSVHLNGGGGERKRAGGILVGTGPALRGGAGRPLPWRAEGPRFIPRLAPKKGALMDNFMKKVLRLANVLENRCKSE